MSLEQNQGVEAEVPNVEAVSADIDVTEATAVPAGGEEGGGDAGEEIPEWRKAFNDLESKYQKQIDKMQTGFEKSIGKIRKGTRDQLADMRKRFDSIVPEPKREHYKTQEDYEAAIAVVKPIREEWSKQEAQFVEAEQREQQTEIQQSFVESYQRQSYAHPKGQEVYAKYSAAITANPAFDLDPDMIAFVGMSDRGVDIVDRLYDNPAMIPQIKAMPTPAKVAFLSNLALSQPSTMNQQVAKAPANAPAPIPKGGARVQPKSITQAKDPAEMFRMMQARKGK